MHVLHTPAKQELIRWLCQHPGSSTAAVAQAFGISGEAARQRLTELETAGILSASVESGHRRGRVVTFTVDTDRLKVLLAALAAYVLGE